LTETSQDERKRGSRRQAVKTFLVADRTPMWFTVAALIAGAGGTYYFAPMLNAEFEQQKIKTDFVIRNYSDLRAKMEDFMGLYAMVTQKLVAGQDIQQDVFKLQEIMGRVNAQNLSLLPMFSTEGGPKAAAQVTTAMNGMLNVIFANAGKTIASAEETKAYSDEVLGASQKLVPPLLELYVRIGDVGHLSPTETNVDLAKDTK
jgi:hypothetical protein